VHKDLELMLFKWTSSVSYSHFHSVCFATHWYPNWCDKIFIHLYFLCLWTFFIFFGGDRQSRDFDNRWHCFGNELRLCSWISSCHRLGLTVWNSASASKSLKADTSRIVPQYFFTLRLRWGFCNFWSDALWALTSYNSTQLNSTRSQNASWVELSRALWTDNWEDRPGPPGQPRSWLLVSYPVPRRK